MVLRRDRRVGSHRALPHVEPEPGFCRDPARDVQPAEHIPENPAVGVPIIFVIEGVPERV